MNLRRILGTRIFTALANAIIRRSLRTPYTHLRQSNGTAYMDRFWLFRIGAKAGSEYPWFGARVHHIQSSDDDRAFHDHPWRFVTIILRGGYTEMRPVQQAPTGGELDYVDVGGRRQFVVWHDYTAGDVLFRDATDWHALTLQPGKPAVTLFIMFRKRQSWGFLWKGEKVPHRVFATANPGRAVYVADTPGGSLLADES